MDAITAGKQLTESRRDFPELAKKWIEFVDATPKTAETYNRAINQFLKYLSSNRIANPDRSDVIGFRESLKSAGRKPATIQNYLTAIRLFFRWTVTEKLFPNIADHVKGLKIDRDHKKDYLRDYQIGEVLDGIDRSTEKGKRDFAIVFLMATTGIRVISVINADLGDMQETAAGKVLFYRGKGHSEKSVFVKLSDPVSDAISEYLETRSGAGDSSPLFASTANRNSGKRLSVRSVSGIVKNHFRVAGLDSDRLTAHSLRHTAATLALKSGATLEETRQLLDHANINTTMIYNHAIEREKNEIESLITATIQKQRKRVEFAIEG